MCLIYINEKYVLVLSKKNRSIPQGCFIFFTVEIAKKPSKFAVFCVYICDNIKATSCALRSIPSVESILFWLTASMPFLLDNNSLFVCQTDMV